MDFSILFIVTVAYIKFVTTQKNLKWNRRTESFDTIANVLSKKMQIQKVMSKDERPELRDFKGQPLKISYYEDLGVFEYYDNDTKVKGICGEIWTTICNFLNFTMVLSKDEIAYVGSSRSDGTYDGILGKIWKNETDVVPHLGMFLARYKAVEFSTVFWMYSVKIYSRGEWIQSPAWMFEIFAQDVWITLLVFLVTLSLANIVTQRILMRYREKDLKSESIVSHLFYNFAVLCNQPSSSSKKSPSGSKLLNVIIIIFAYLTLAAYNSRLIFNLAQESFAAPFNDVYSLMNKTKYRMVVVNGSTAHRIVISEFGKEVFEQVRKSPRLKVVQRADDLYAYVCNQPDKYVFLDTDNVVAVRNTGECDVEPVGEAYYSTPVASGFSHGFYASKTVNFWLTRLREFGLLDAMKKRYMSPTRKKPKVRHRQTLTIDMDRVSVIFGVLGLGMLTSILICVVENIIFKKKRQKPVKLDIKKLNIYEQPIIAKLILENRARGRYRK
ncbi:uncharacterized protein [Venturia canescens]|uniref:uncharacterized protein n=1 Tax=Venturia canescens TaxID=32260 RepID=UPI001C9CAA1A|nr:uncharacterized protein LOC122405950 [Venturia canescens]